MALTDAHSVPPVHRQRPQGQLEGYLIMFFLGTGCLLPWNGFITAVDYFSEVYPGQHVNSVFPLAYQVPNLLALLLLVRFLDKTSPSTRITLGFFAFALLMALVPLLDALALGRGGQGSPLSFGLTVAAVGVVGVVSACTQGSLFGFTAQLPPIFMPALNAGTSASGLIMSALRLLTKLVFPDTPSGLRWSAYVYFGISTVVLVLCLSAYHRLLRVPALGLCRSSIAAAAVPQAEEHRLQGGALVEHRQWGPSEVSAGKGVASANRLEEGDRLGSSFVNNDEALDESALRSPLLNSQKAEDSGEASCPEGATSPDVPRQLVMSAPARANFWVKLFFLDVLALEGKAESVQRSGRQLDVLTRIWPFALAMAAVMAVTLCIFPGFISELEDETLGSWYPILLMAAFNTFDFFGKFSPTFFTVHNHRLLFFLSYLRVLFLPLYYACFRFESSWVMTRVFLPLLTSILGFSNGVLTSLILMAAPSVVPRDLAEATGALMVLFLILGLALGSVGAWLWVLVLSK